MSATLHIQEQPRLPIHKQIEICADGIHHRLFRSMLTLSIVVLAVAFLMNVLTESVLAQAAKQVVFSLADEARLLSRFDSFLQGPVSPAAARKRIAASPAEGEEAWRGRALAAWLGLTAPQYEQLRDRALEAERHFDWFEKLSMAHRRMLVGNMPDDEAMRVLAGAEAQDRFRQAMQQIPTLSEPDGLLDFAAGYPAAAQEIEQAAARITRRLQAVREQMPAPTVSAWLVESAGDAGRQGQVRRFLQEQHVSVDESTWALLLDQARRMRQYQHLYELLAEPALAGAWQSRYREIFEVDLALRVLASDESRVRWLLAHSGVEESQVSARAAELRPVIEDLVRQRNVTETEARLVAGYGRQEGMGTRVFWLIVVSLLVCIVGIANAMLVSVLERFREIATMKCLGALDGFIAVLFLLEAAFLGAVGGLAGVVLGFIIGVARMWVGYGNWIWMDFPTVSLLGAAAVSILCGLGLATLAAIYPAFMASRMPPMEAMRVE